MTYTQRKSSTPKRQNIALKKNLYPQDVRQVCHQGQQAVQRGRLHHGHWQGRPPQAHPRQGCQGHLNFSHHFLDPLQY